MAIVNKTEAARLAGCGKKRLYELIRDGKISVSKDNAGREGIETSEILRVFGEIKPIAQGAALGDEKKAPPDQSAAIIAELRAENAGLKTRISDLSDHIQTLKAELAAAKEREIRMLPTQTDKKGFFTRLFG